MNIKLSGQSWAKFRESDGEDRKLAKLGTMIRNKIQWSPKKCSHQAELPFNWPSGMGGG